jgi:hypothetical protein
MTTPKHSGEVTHPFGAHGHRFARFRVHRLAIDGPPSRRLRVHVALDNRSQIPGVLLSSWAEARFEPGGVAAYGALFQQQHALAHAAILPPSGSMSGEFAIPISPEILDAVERQRSDGVTLMIEGHLIVAPLLQPTRARRGSPAEHPEPIGMPVLGLPMTTLAADDYGTAMVTHRIARSEWGQFVSGWRWSEVELFEVALSPRSSSVEGMQAYSMLRLAERAFREHDFRGTLTHSRSAMEAFAKASGDGDMKRGYAASLAAKVAGEQMRDDLNALLHALSTFAHAGRHARVPDEPVTRDDALLVLRMTLAALERLTR